MTGLIRPQEVDEGVTSPFDREGVEPSSYSHPELIAQITRHVIKQLQSGDGLDNSTPVPRRNRLSPPPPPPPPPPRAQQTITPSPFTTSGTSPDMPNQEYPPPLQHEPTNPSHASSQSQPGNLRNGPQSPREPESIHFSPPRRSPSSQSQTSDSSGRGYGRPKGPLRLSTKEEITTMERIWGQLFDEDSHPTVKLGQFLRGLAAHIIEDYEPRHSLVITPVKMAKYYEDVKVTNECYPWSAVFGEEQFSISRIYRELKCQHHLVQENSDARPTIPGLTPVGFEKWVTLLIQAYPEEEFERLQNAARELPINNPDNKKERFPKEISRRLFPRREDPKIRDRIKDSIFKHVKIELPRRSSQEGPRPHRGSPPHKSSVTKPTRVPPNHPRSVSFDLPTNSASNSIYIPSHLRCKRKPFSNTSSEPAMPTPPSSPIDRYRKPCSAPPASEKQVEDDGRREYPTKPRSDPIAISVPKLSRSDSTACARPQPVSDARSMEIPKAEVNHHNHAPINATRGHRSLSFSRDTTNDLRPSGGNNRGYHPGLYQASGSVPLRKPPV